MKQKLSLLHQRLTQTVLGSEEASYLVTVALLCNGHVLIQGAPGIGKTSLAQTLARTIDGSFRRVQFTPDLLPSDILGYSMYHQGTGQFQFIEGPVFANILLADEINRTSPRIQSALLEAMNEGQVSIDGVTRKLPNPFLVIATQNNMYASGTFPLPEPQLDRFLLSITMFLPDLDTQTQILRLHSTGFQPEKHGPIVAAQEIRHLQHEVDQLSANERICRYIAQICENLRAHKTLGKGLSARASIALLRAAKAAAFLEGHSAVYPDDVKSVAFPVLSHRLGGKDTQGGAKAVSTAIDDVLQNTPAP